MIGRDEARAALGNLARQAGGIDMDATIARVRSARVAGEALVGMSDRERVHFALMLIMNTRDPMAAGAVAFAARRIADHAKRLEQDSDLPEPA